MSHKRQALVARALSIAVPEYINISTLTILAQKIAAARINLLPPSDHHEDLAIDLKMKEFDLVVDARRSKKIVFWMDKAIKHLKYMCNIYKQERLFLHTSMQGKDMDACHKQFSDAVNVAFNGLHLLKHLYFLQYVKLQKRRYEVRKKVETLLKNNGRNHKNKQSNIKK